MSAARSKISPLPVTPVESTEELLGEALESAAWGAVRDTLETRLSGHTFRTYVASARVLSTATGILRLGYSNRFLIDMVRDHYRATFEEELLQVANRRIAVELELDETQAIAPAPAPAKAKAKSPAAAPARPVVEPLGPGEPPPQQRIQGGLDTRYTFESFVTGTSNHFAHAACQAVSAQPGKLYSPLFLWGGSGLGKTHLMQAVGHEVVRHDPRKQVLYATSEQFTNELIAAIQTRRMNEFRRRYREVDVLLIDDVQFLARKPATEEEFFHTFNALHQAGKQIIVSSDTPPQDIDHLEERLRSRFRMGLVADIQAPDMDTRVAILKAKSRAMSVELPQDVAVFLASHVRQNVRELEGALLRITAYANLMRGPLTVDVCREVLRSLLVNQGRKVDTDLIIKRCAEHFRVTIADIKGRVRKKQIVRARQAAMYLARRLTKSSYPELGGQFGGKDHSTVINAVKRVPQIMAEDEDFRASVESLEREMSQPA